MRTRRIGDRVTVKYTTNGMTTERMAIVEDTVPEGNWLELRMLLNDSGPDDEVDEWIHLAWNGRRWVELDSGTVWELV